MLVVARMPQALTRLSDNFCEAGVRTTSSAVKAL